MFNLKYILNGSTYRGSTSIVLGVLLCLFFLAPEAHAATIGKPVSNLSLLGYWSFDEGGGTKAHDLSGRGNTGTLTNGPTWVDGKRGKALSFSSASSQYVSVGSNLLSGNEPFTIAAWVNPADLTTTWKTIFAENCNGPDLTINQGSIMAGRNCGQGNGFNLSHPLTAGEANTWIFVTMTFDGANARLYKNGTLVSGPVAATYAAGGHGAAFIGSYSTTFEPFNGKIDDVRLYGRALSASEIVSLYTSGQSSNLAATKTGLAGYWSMNEGSGTIAHDQSGNGKNATLTNGPTWTDGKLGKAVSLDGVNDYLSLSGITAVPVNGPATISGWFYATTTAIVRGSSLFLFEDLYQHPLNNMLYLANGADYFSVAAPFAPNTWHHVVLTYNGTHETSILYLDGVRYDVNIQTAGQDHMNLNPLFIGSDSGGGGGTFGGKIDDFRIYNRVLTQDEAFALFKARDTTINQSQNNRLTDGLVGYWTFNGPDVTTTVTDVSGRGNHGYLYGSATSSAKTIGKVGQALYFNGTTDYVQVADSSSLDVTGAVTMAAWIKAPNGLVNDFESIIQKSNSSTQGYQVGFSSAADNYIRCDLANGSGYASFNNSTNVTDGRWHHVACTYDGSVGYVYVDGVPGTAGVLSNYVVPSGLPLTIGYDRCCGGSRKFKGMIDEARVYNRSLSATEVKQLYNMGR